MRHLEQVTRGELDRLLISAPPGSAKSRRPACSLPAHFLANHPTAQIVTASHTETLAERFGRRVRNLIAEHGATLGLQLSDDSQAAGRGSLKSGGSLFAVGASGALAGYRADLVILDDVYRSMEDAYSDTVRQKISEWFFSEVLPRMRPGAKVVGIGTRFHHADLFAELEATGRYKVIKLSAVAEGDDELGRPPGTFLWDDQPGTYPYADFLRHQKEVQPPRVWASLFMNRPSPEEGAFFKADWLKTYHHPPPRENFKTYIAVDFATSEGKGDYTAIVAFGVPPAGDIFVLNVWRRQASPDVSVDALLDMLRDFKPLVVVTEAGGLKNAIGPFLKERMNQRRIYAAVETIPSRHTKEIRAQSIAGRMAVRAAISSGAGQLARGLRQRVARISRGTERGYGRVLQLAWAAAWPARPRQRAGEEGATQGAVHGSGALFGHAYGPLRAGGPKEQARQRKDLLKPHVGDSQDFVWPTPPRQLRCPEVRAR